MNQLNVEKLPELLSAYVSEGKTIVDTKLSYLTAPGENYLSTMLRVEFVVEDATTGRKEEHHAVAKCFPQEPGPGSQNGEGEGFMDKIHGINFKNELVFYQEILPCLKEFQKKHGVKEFDIFPKLIAGRRNLHGNDGEVDKNAVLILENLVTEGFAMGDRHIGLNLEESRVILKDLAELHGTVLALKLKEPEVFESKIKNNIVKFDWPPPEELRLLYGLLSGDPSIEKPLKKIQELEEENKKKGMNPFNRPSREPFATLIHNDMWLNNTMQKHMGETIKNVFVDFQIYSINSPIADLIFFIFTSVQPAIIALHLDRLIKQYHGHFVDTLKAFGCNARPFAYDKFMEELKTEAPSELQHALFMSIFIFGKKGAKVMDFDSPMDKSKITNLALEKCKVALKVFEEKGWL